MRRRELARLGMAAALGSPFSVAGAQDVEPLLAFRRALLEASNRRVRIGVYGASHTASDEFTRVLRRGLSQRFGDGGLGWFMPASPFTFYERADVECHGRGWVGRRVRGRERSVDDYGLAGFALETHEGATSRTRLPAGLEGQRLSVSYLARPDGGCMTIECGGEEYRVECAGRRETKTAVITESMGPSRTLRLRAEGRVRLFGFDLSSTAGVSVDAFGVPGARSRDQLPWRLRSLRASLAARPFDLVILAYGTNESSRRGRPSDIEDLRRVVRRWRTLSPNASMLLVGPGEWPRHRRGEWRRRPRTHEVIALQRRVAREEGCGYFDVLSWMGGDGSMVRWVEEGLAEADHVHFTPRGYARLGAALEAHLVGRS